MIETHASVNLSALTALKSVLGEDFPELIHDFNIHSSDCLIKMEHAIAHDDRATIKQLAHSLKGAALSMHAKALSDCCAELESSATFVDKPQLREMIQRVHDEVKEVITVIEEWLGR